MGDPVSASKSVEICLTDPKLEIKQEVVINFDNEDKIIVPKKVYTKRKNISNSYKNVFIVPKEDKIEFSNSCIEIINSGQTIIKSAPINDSDNFSNISSSSAKFRTVNVDSITPIKGETLLYDEINKLQRIMALRGLEIIPICDTDASTKSVKIENAPSSGLSSVYIESQPMEGEVDRNQPYLDETEKSFSVTNTSGEKQMISYHKTNHKVNTQEQHSINKTLPHKGIFNKKKYLCEECDYVSFYLGSLENHIETHHTKNKTLSTTNISENKSYITIIDNEDCLQEQKCSIDTIQFPSDQTKRLKSTNTSKVKDKKLYCSKNSSSTSQVQSPYIINNEMLLLEQHSSSNRTQHLKKKRSKRVFSCKLCDFKCSVPVNLRNHLEVEHNISPQIYSCVYCDVKYLRKCYLIKHMEKHKELYFCVKCEFRGLTMYSLKTHMLTHSCSQEKTYICDFCDLNFNCKDNLITHISLHKDVNPYECVDCDESFSNKRLLECHINNHHHQNLICTKCDLTFTNKNKLKQHMKSHGINRPIKKNVYSCRYCYFKCENATILSQHVVIAHVGDNLFSCENCSFECDTRSGLEFHKETCRQEVIIKIKMDQPKKPKTVASSFAIKPLCVDSNRGSYTKPRVKQVFIKSEINLSSVYQYKRPRKSETSCISRPFRYHLD